jgi:hypothetical protein
MFELCSENENKGLENAIAMWKKKIDLFQKAVKRAITW